MNRVIAIAGPSGVGKTTIANLLKISFECDKAVVISGDDLHLWERGDDNWNHYTHLNPEANNIKKGVHDITQLKKDKEIYRNVYCHETGKFIRDVNFLPKKNIIHEGLHALYAEFKDISDVRIYVSTNNDLKVKWKLLRDVHKRGYSKEQVVSAINKRIPDEERYILPQKNDADLLVKFVEKHGKIYLKFDKIVESSIVNKIAKRLDDTYTSLCEFVDISAEISKNKTLCINSGGNMSYKQSDKMIVTASGKDFSNVSMFDGYTVVYRDNLEKVFHTAERPSMEAGIHSLFDDSVLHSHPVYLNCFLCCKESDELIHSMMRDLELSNYSIEDYVSPGKSLLKHLQNKKLNSIIFLKNHGIFVSDEKLSNCLKLTNKINEYCKEKLNKMNPSFVQYEEYDTYNFTNHLFPDSVVYENKNRVLNYYTYENIINSGLNPNFLSSENIEVIENMEEEKYRKESQQ